MNSDQKFKVIKKILKNKPTVIEIGAHYGEDSIRFLNAFKDIILYCIEPDPRNIIILRKHIKDRRMHLHEVAISNKDGVSDFYLSYDKKITEKTLQKYYWIKKKDYIDLKLNSSGASSLKKGYPLCNDIVMVKTYKLSTWASRNNISNVDFLWVDVQGAERDVIEGIENINIKFIWIEYGETEYNGALTRAQTISLLKEKGFSVIEKYSSKGSKGDLLFKNENHN